MKRLITSMTVLLGVVSLFATESMFTRKYYATASYANQIEIPVNTTGTWTVEELTDDRGGFSIVSPIGTGNPGDKLVIAVTKHTDLDKVYNASYKVTPASGAAETIYFKQASAIETAVFTGTDWDIDQGTPTFADGVWTMHTGGSKLDIETNKSMSITVDNMLVTDRLAFYYYSQKGSYRSVYFDINTTANKTDIYFYEYGDKAPTAEEKATFEQQVNLVRGQQNKYDIHCFPTPEGNIIALYINEVFVTEVDPTFTNKYLGGEPWRYMLRGFVGGASKITQWGESKLGINDAQWEYDTTPTSVDAAEVVAPFVRKGNDLLFAEPTQVEVYNVTGALIHSGMVNTYELPSAGIYVIRTNVGSFKIAH